MYDVTVIGCGVVGAFAARELTKYNLKVCMLERMSDVCMGASKSNSGIVHAGFDAKENTLKAQLNVRGNKLMEKVCLDLGVKFRRNTSLVVAFNDEEKEKLEILLERGRKNDVYGLELIDGNQARRLEPNLSKNIIAALLAPTGGIVCPYELTIAACGNAMDNGAELKLNFDVTEINKTDNGFEIKSGNEIVESKYVINAAGVYSDKIASLVGDNSFTITPRIGEYMILDKETGKLCNATIFRTPTKMGKGILVSPTVDGNILLGPTSVDSDSKEDTSTTISGLETIIEQTSQSVPATPVRSVITSFAGIRAVGSTGDFIINNPVHGFINCAGIESPGLTSAPAIGEYVVSLLFEDGLELTPSTSFDGHRKTSHEFREMSLEDKNKVIKEHPEYGRIICRCEGISLGEILEAMRTNPKATDLDGIKRRTRSGMGRCQGGFCSPVITEIISKELGIPFEKVTKCGGESLLNLSKTKEGKK